MTLILSVLLLSCICIGTAAGEPNSASLPVRVEVRVHVPYQEILANEHYHWGIVRIENRGEQKLPIFTNQGGTPTALAQFQTQIRESEESLKNPQLAPWAEIVQQAEWSLRPNEAVEMLVTSAKGIHLDPSGESRLALQIGPNVVVYSNWVRLQTLPGQRVDQWAVIANGQLTPGDTGLSEFVTTSIESDLWLFERPVWNKNIIHRICLLPDSEIPRIVVDMKKSQAMIEFSSHSEATTYFNARLGLSRSTPWPDGNISNDFIGKPIPVDAPSPLEFPLELFVENHGKTSTSKALDQSATRQSSGGVKDRSPSNDHPTAWPPVWFWIAGTCTLVGILAVKMRVARAKR